MSANHYNNSQNNAITNNNNTGAIVLDNIDDYLAPSQACINPAFQPSAASVENDDGTTKSKSQEVVGVVQVPAVRRRRRRLIPPVKNTSNNNNNNNDENSNDQKKQQDWNGEEIGIAKKKKDAVKASMADCLACSGCVTTAETVLMEQKHSLKSLRKRLQLDNDTSQSSSSRHRHRRRRAMTISPNAWADLCRHFQLQPDQFSQFATLLYQVLQATLIIDGNVPLQWTWWQEAQEFVQVYRQKQKQQQLSPPSTTTSAETQSLASLPSMALDSERTMYYHPNGTTTTIDVTTTLEPTMPIISGSCPALVCLVEKSLSSLVPHLSCTQSPMSRMGTLLSMLSSSSSSSTTFEWDHWAIMPCHDKKLEASRPDFLLSNKDSDDQKKKQPAVDLVITTLELVELLEEWKEQQQQSTTQKNMSMAEWIESQSPAKEQAVTFGVKNNNGDGDNDELAVFQQALSQSWSGDDDDNDFSKPVCWTTTAAEAAPIEKAPALDGPTSSSPKATTFGKNEKRMAFSSGGHSDFIFRYAAQELFGVTLDQVDWQPFSNSALTGSNGNNNNNNSIGGVVIKSARLARKQQQQQQQIYQAQLVQYEDGTIGPLTTIPNSPTTPQPGNCDDNTDGGLPAAPRVVLSMGIAHGMQTMQRALKQISTETSTTSSSTTTDYVPPTWHYLEAMACPYGCVNGGGGVAIHNKVVTTTTTTATSTTRRETPTETRQRVEATVEHLVVPHITVRGKKEKSSSSPSSVVPKTRYHVVPPMQYTMGAAAGVKVQDMQW